MRNIVCVSDSSHNGKFSLKEEQRVLPEDREEWEPPFRKAKYTPVEECSPEDDEFSEEFSYPPQKEEDHCRGT